MNTPLEAILIETNPHQTFRATLSLRCNCTHVDGNIWICKDDTEALAKDGIVFREIDRGAMAPMPIDSTPQQLHDMCLNCFDIKEDIFRKDYHEPGEQETEPIDTPA